MNTFFSDLWLPRHEPEVRRVCHPRHLPLHLPPVRHQDAEAEEALQG